MTAEVLGVVIDQYRGVFRNIPTRHGPGCAAARHLVGPPRSEILPPPRGQGPSRLPL
jgi:hypothetical protein